MLQESLSTRTPQGPGRRSSAPLRQALLLCLQGERVLSTELRRELAARGLDLETFARALEAPRVSV
jgi:hypothetical protein